MKKTLYILLSVLTATAFFANCAKDPVDSEVAAISAEWELTLWNGAAPDDFETYLAFAEDNTFAIYQQFERSYYQKYTGTYSIADNLLSGKYKDGSSLGSSYHISYGDNGQTLTMTSVKGAEVSVYTKTSIPDGIKNNAVLMDTVTRAPVCRLL